MTSITAITLNALANDQARIERTASNLANLQTPGYKRELWVERPGATDSFEQAMHAAAPGAAAPPPPALVPSALPVAALARDMKPGTLRPTGRPLDLALAGPGYFEVATERGPAYTRRGDFQVDSRGRLVTPDGHALLGAGGEIAVSGGHIEVEASGRVLDGGRQVGQLRVVDLTGHSMTAIGAGLYVSTGAAHELRPGESAVRQGFLENANVDTAHEMVGLAATTRHFEAVLRVAQGRDELLGTAIRRLGEV